MVEFSHALIYQGPGTYWAGITGLIRYNFLPRDSKWTPYIQAGAGLVLNDAYKDHSQDAIGKPSNLFPKQAWGFGIFLRKRGPLILKESSGIFPMPASRSEMRV